MKAKDWVTLFYVVTGLGVLIGLFWLFMNMKKWIQPSETMNWWMNIFGLSKKPVKDLTGDLGEQVSKAAEAKATSSTAPQIQYGQARSKFAKARGLNAAWDNLLLYGWPYREYKNWAEAGMPTLPT